MSHTITVRLTEELASWLRETAQRLGVPAGRIVRNELERAKDSARTQRFMRLAGQVSGPPDLSQRKGFSKG